MRKLGCVSVLVLCVAAGWLYAEDVPGMDVRQDAPAVASQHIQWESTGQRSTAVSPRQDNLEIRFSPKGGIFFPVDKYFSDARSQNYIVGLGVTFWRRHKGVMFEIENSKMSYYQTYGSYYGWYRLKQEMSVNPVMLSLLYRTCTPVSLYAGIGGGIAFAQGANFSGGQGIVGVSFFKVVDITAKYYGFDTFNDGNKLSGYSVALQLNL